MRRAAALATIVLVTALRADAAPPAADDLAPLRGHVDALVKSLADGVVADGPSPTARVFQFAVYGDAKTRVVLEQAWRIVVGSPNARRFQPALARLTAFLYPTADAAPAAPGAYELVEIDGAVRVRRVEAPAKTEKRFDVARPATVGVPRNVALRRPSLADTRKLVAALDAGKVPDAEIEQVAAAVGEACAADPPHHVETAKRLVADRDAGWTTSALAAMGTPEAWEELKTRFATCAQTASKEHDAADVAKLAATCRALERWRRGAGVSEIAEMDHSSGAVADAASSAAGIDVAVRADATRREGGASTRGTLNVQTTFMRLVDAGGDASISGATRAELAPTLLRELDAASKTDRALVASAARALFWTEDADAPPPAGTQRLGPYPDVENALKALTSDLASGDVAFLDGGPSIFDIAVPAAGESAPQLVPDAPTAPGAPPPPYPRATLKGEIFGQWLRLALTNVGERPFSVDPTALRYVVAERVVQDVYGGPGVARVERRLKLTFGAPRGGMAVKASQFAVVEPKATYPIVVDLRPEDRKTDHVEIELRGGFVVLGKPTAPELASFPATPVK